MVSKFYPNLIKWALTEMECSVAGTTTLDREWLTYNICQISRDSYPSYYINPLFQQYFSYKIGGQFYL